METITQQQQYHNGRGVSFDSCMLIVENGGSRIRSRTIIFFTQGTKCWIESNRIDSRMDEWMIHVRSSRLIIVSIFIKIISRTMIYQIIVYSRKSRRRRRKRKRKRKRKTRRKYDWRYDTFWHGCSCTGTILQTHYSYNILPGVFSKQKRRETRVIIVHINRIHLIL